jgi:beta-galactosidase
MDPGWRFTLGDPAGAERPGFDDRSWRRLDLPHDWSIEGTPREDAPGGGRVGYFPSGLGWYRKAFRLPAGSTGRTAWLEFDGIYMNSDVWINGVHLGRRPFGYISLKYDVTRHLVPGINVVAVRVDNSAQPNSRWYTGSGIYRHVWLTLVDPLHVGHWGTFVTTPRADSAGADVVVATQVDNYTEVPRRGLLRSVVLDSAGREVARTESFILVPAGGNLAVEQRLTIAAPRLWSVATPHLYTLRSEVHTRLRPTDQTSTTFGIRSIAYDKDRGFLLNGRRIKMRGVNLHHGSRRSRRWERTRFVPPTIHRRLNSSTSATGWDSW